MSVFVTPMPLNKDGQGPEMDNRKVTEIRWQLWDADTFEFIAEYSSKDEAFYQRDLLNESLSGM